MKVRTILIGLLALAMTNCGGGASAPTTPAQLPTQIEYASVEFGAGDAIVVGGISGLSGSISSSGKAAGDSIPDAIYAIDSYGVATEATIDGDYFYLKLQTGRPYMVTLMKGAVALARVTISAYGYDISSVPLTYVEGAASSGTAKLDGATLIEGDIQVADIGTLSISNSIAKAALKSDVAGANTGLNLDAAKAEVASNVDKWLTRFANMDIDQNDLLDMNEYAYTENPNAPYGCDLPSSLDDFVNIYVGLGFSNFVETLCKKNFTFEIKYTKTSDQSLDTDLTNTYADLDQIPDPASEICFHSLNVPEYLISDPMYLFSDKPISLTNGAAYAAYEGIVSGDVSGFDHCFLDLQSELILQDANYYISLDSTLDEGTDLLFANVKAPSIDYSIAPVPMLVVDNTNKITAVKWKWLKNGVDATEDEVKAALQSFLTIQGTDDLCDMYPLAFSLKSRGGTEYLHYSDGIGMNVVFVPRSGSTCTMLDDISGLDGYVLTSLKDGQITLDTPLEVMQAGVLEIAMSNASANRVTYQWWNPNYQVNGLYIASATSGCGVADDQVEFIDDGSYNYHADINGYRVKMNTVYFPGGATCTSPKFGPIGSELDCSSCSRSSTDPLTLTLSGCTYLGSSCDMTFVLK